MILVGQLQFMMKNIVHKWSHVTIKSVSGATAVLTERRPYTTYDSRLNTYSEVNDRARLLCRAGFYQTAQGLVRCCLCDVSFSIDLSQLSGDLSSVERFHARWGHKNSVLRTDFWCLGLNCISLLVNSHWSSVSASMVKKWLRKGFSLHESWGPRMKCLT